MADKKKSPKEIAPAEMLDYTSKAVQGCAIVVRAYEKDFDGTPDLRRLVQVQEDIRIQETDPATGKPVQKDIPAGGYIDTTDPTDMRGVTQEALAEDYGIADRYVVGQGGRGTRVLNYVAGDEAVFGGEKCTVLSSASVEANVLFNENDSCGEVVPLEDASVRYRRPDGTTDVFRISTLDNIVASHGDLSDTRFWADLSGGKHIPTPDESRAENDFKARMMDEMLRSQYAANHVFPELGETKESVLKAQLESRNPYLEAQAERIGRESRQSGRSAKAQEMFAIRDREAAGSTAAPEAGRDVTD